MTQFLFKNTVRLCFLGCVLGLWSNTIQASWTPVEFGEDEEHSVYFDRKSIEVHGAYVQAWALFDNKKPIDIDGKHISSSKLLTEYDCRNKKSRIVKAIFYSKAMGTGTIQGSESKTDSTFGQIQTGSLDEKVLKVACSLPRAVPPNTQG